VLVFVQDEELETTPTAPVVESAADALAEDGGPRRRSGRYGAVGVSEPLAAGVAVPVDKRASAGNSRSRSKGRTPPRTVVRPMTRARRDAALAAGASLTALPPVSTSVASGGYSPATPLSEHVPSHGASPEFVAHSPGTRYEGREGRRGRSAEERPITPVVASVGLPDDDDEWDDDFDDEEDEEEANIARHVARRAHYVPGAGVTGELLSADPADNLDARDLDLPTDEHGHEVHSARGALSSELPLIIRSTIPVFFAQLAEYSLSLASVISIGHLGTEQLAASSLANMTASVTCFSIVQGLATALDTLLPAAWTSNDPSRVGLWTQRMAVVMAVAIIPMFVLWFSIERILLFLHQEPAVASLAALYLRYMTIGIPGYAANIVLKKYLQAQNIMHIPTYVLFVVAPLNLLLNYLLVWGPDALRLGFVGGAVATAISFNLTGLLLLIYVLYLGPREAFHPVSLHAVFSKLGTVTSLGLAGTVMLSSEWWAWEICALASSLLGPTTLAAQSVLLSTCSTLYQFPAALGVAASVRVGNLLGAGRAWEAKWASRASFILAFGFALFNSTICIVFRHNWGYMFNNDPEVVRLVAQVMPWIGVFQVMDGMAGAANAVLRALALHSTGALVNLTAYYVVGLPLGLWLTFTPWIPIGLVGIWIGLTVALTYASAVGVWIVWEVDWARGVERVRERLGLSQLPPDTKFADEPEPAPRANGAANADPERQPLLSA
jgi:MATE family multidrug resistance protein